MPEVTSHQPGTFSWVELATTDREAAIDFYKKLFGWTTVDHDMGPNGIYTIAQKNGRDVGGIANRQNDQIPPNWASYITVSSADDTANRAKSLGGQIVSGPFDVMDLGRMAVINDVSGATFCIWQPMKNNGAGIVGDSGSLSWNELTVSDGAPAKKFYPELFGWTMKESPEYTEWHLGERGVGGMYVMDVPHAFWMPYFAVDDCDASAKQITSSGGKLYKEPTDIPNVGRFAVAVDPQGAVFAIIKLTMAH